MRALLLGNVVVSGDAGRFPNMAERLKMELQALHPSVRVNVVMAAPNSGWKGAKLFSTMDSYAAHCTNAADVQRYSRLSHRFF
jgi:actin-related protein